MEPTTSPFAPLIRPSRAASLLLAATLLIVGCDAGSFVGPTTDPGTVEVTGEAGGSIDLRVQILDQHGDPVTDAAVEWRVTLGTGTVSPSTSTTDAIGYTDATWTLGLEGGEQELTASTEDSSVVKVKGKAPKSAVAEVYVAPESVKLEVGQETQLEASATREDGSTVPGGHISWKSLDESVATVNNNGRVGALVAGTALVVAVAGTLADTALVEVAELGGVDSTPTEQASYFEEDFSGYTDSAHWRTDPNGWYYLEDPNEHYIDTTHGYGSLTQSLRIEHRADMQYDHNPGAQLFLAHANVLGANATSDLWVEIYARFDTRWRTSRANYRHAFVDNVAGFIEGETLSFSGGGTDVLLRAVPTDGVTDGFLHWRDDKAAEMGEVITGNTSGATATVTSSTQYTSSNPDHKFIFLTSDLAGAVGTGRYQLKVGNFGHEVATGAPSTGGYSAHDGMAADLWDGNWHRFRFHARPTPGNGYYKVWVDDTVLTDGSIGTDTHDHITSVYLGRNKNVPHLRETIGFNIGRVRLWTTDPGW